MLNCPWCGDPLKRPGRPFAGHAFLKIDAGISAGGGLECPPTDPFAAASSFLRSASELWSPSQLTWYDRAGKAVGIVGEPALYGDPVLSPDGTRLAVTKQTGSDTSDIWLLDLSPGGASTRFTFGSIKPEALVWSPDGKSIIFESNADGPDNLYQKPADGLKEEMVLLKSSENKFPTSWSTDGRFLLYTVVDQKTKADIWVLPLAGNRNPVPFLITDFAEGDARFSPDGHWVAYDSDESGEIEVYVRSFSMNSAGTAMEAGGKWQISNGGGGDPRWGGDGRKLFYTSYFDGRRMAVEIATGSAFHAGKPQLLGPAFPGAWDFTRDGKRFLVVVPGSDKPAPFTVVLNWPAGLKK
jgi:Tol biopolymer transport system component